MPQMKTIIAVAVGVAVAPYVQRTLNVQSDPSGFGLDDVVIIGSVVAALVVAHKLL